MYKKNLKFLVLQLFIFLLIGIQVKPNLVYASELIGVNISQESIPTQINIILNVLIPNGLEPGSPVTVSVPVAYLKGTQLESVKLLAQTLNSANYFPIIKVTGVCEDFTSLTAKDAPASVDTLKEIFGQEAIIVWGDKINNKNENCQNWDKYLTDYIQIEGRQNVTPSTLDYYITDPNFTVTNLFTTIPTLKAIYDNAPKIAALGYGCVGADLSTCNPTETNTQELGFKDFKVPVYLTEFSLSAENKSVTSPDTNLPNVINFISNKAGNTGAVKVTPLVRNVCNSEGAWLYYINGQLFTQQGTVIEGNCERKSSASLYNLASYPDYNVDENQFFVSPIKNLVDSANSQYTVAALRTELAKQGYQAYCASDNITIEPSYNTQELIDEYFKLYPNGVQVLETDAIQTLSSSNAQYPLWRDTSNKRFLLSSLEEYFGFKDVYQTQPGKSILTSSPINSLLSEPQMCLQGWNNLVTQEKACKRLENPEECALLKRPIPDTEYTVKTLLEELKQYEPSYKTGKAKEGCINLASKDRANYSKLFKGLINTPTYFDRAYRYGFIVAVIHSKSPLTDSGNIATKIFNFFTQTTIDEQPSDEVLVAAFKLPDIGTNKWPDETNATQVWEDPLSLTRLLLSTNKKNKLHESNDQVSDPDEVVIGRNEKAKEILTNANKAKNQKPSSKIFCAISSEDANGQQNISKATTSCQNNLTKALTDLINGNAQSCGDNPEAVNIINDFAGLGNPEDSLGKVFNQNNGAQVLLNLFKEDKTHPSAGSGTNPQIARTDDPAEKLRSLFTLNKNTWSKKEAGTTVDFYLVYPVGFELDAVEEAMKGAFFTRAQLAKLEQQQNSDSFEMAGLDISLLSSTDSFNYNNTQQTENGKCGSLTQVNQNGELIELETNKPCTKKVSVSVNQQGETKFAVLGAKLGYWLRKIQMQLNPRKSTAWEYLSSCSSTEDFLLGKCKKQDEGNSEATPPEEVGTNIEIVAQCLDGARVTSGEDAQQIETTGTGACTDKATNEYVADLHNIPNWKDPNDPVIDCQKLYSQVACTYPNSLVQNPVDSSGKFSQDGTQTACQYIVQRAKELGVSPRLTLAMWGEESGFSNLVEPPTPDLGVISRPALDLDAQVTAFANTLKSYDNYLSFLEAYSGEERGSNDPSPKQFCNNRYFPARLRVYYDYLGPQ